MLYDILDNYVFSECYLGVIIYKPMKPSDWMFLDIVRKEEHD